MNSLIDSAIPVVALVLSIGGPLVIAALAIMASHKKDMALQELVANAASAGRSPAEIREIVATLNPRTSKGRSGSLKVGIILVAAAVAMGLVAITLDRTEMFAPAVFSLFIGAAFLVIWRIVDRTGGEK